MRLFLTLASLGTLFASEADDWNRVKALTKGASVTVIQADMKSVRGTLDAAADDVIVIDGVNIPKSKVVRVTAHRQSRRVSNAVFLAIAGALIGAAATRFGVSCAETDNGCQIAAVAPFAGAAGGAAIGGLALGDSVEIYRVKKVRAGSLLPNQ